MEWDREVIEGLRKVAGGRGGRGGRGGAATGAFRFLGAPFVESATPSVASKPHEGDLQAVVRAIRGAKRQADW